MVKIALIITGDEIMCGDLLDTNSQFVLSAFSEQGYHISQVTTLGDEIEAITEKIRECSQNFDVIIINGGLGPTVDDHTVKALAQVVNEKLVLHPQAVEHLTSYLKKSSDDIDDANIKQAILPENSSVIPNPNGTAVGILSRKDNAYIFSTPGVPSEMKPMIREHILPFLKEKFASTEYKTFYFYTLGIGESFLQNVLTERKLIDNSLRIGFRATFPYVILKISINSKEEMPLFEESRRQLYHCLGAYIISEREGDIVGSVFNILQENKMSLGIAESCTGGLLTSLITRIPHSSSILKAGYVTYSNEAKMECLGVKRHTLDEKGAVSKEVVLQMVKGTTHKARTDIGIAVTGICGPGGGSEEKPIGTIWFAWKIGAEMFTRKCVLRYNRIKNQRISAYIAFDFLRRYFLKKNIDPCYSADISQPFTL